MHQRTKTNILNDFVLFADLKADSRHRDFITPGLGLAWETLFYQQEILRGRELFTGHKIGRFIFRQENFTPPVPINSNLDPLECLPS